MVAAVSLRNSGTAPTCRSSWLGATDGPHSQTKLSSGKKMQVQPQSVPVIGIYQSDNELEHADGGVACEAEQRIAERPGPPPSLLLQRLQLPRLSAGGCERGAHLSPVIGRASSKQIAFAYRLRLFSVVCPSLQVPKACNLKNAQSVKIDSRFKGFGRFSRTTNERPKGSHYCNIGSRACAISQPMISALWLVEPPRPERPWWPASISVRSSKSRRSVLLARSRATHLAGSA
jgi:hypothetical protein